MVAEPVVQSGHGGQVTSAAFAPDSRTLATIDAEGALKLWDARTGEVTRAWEASSQSPLLFSPDGRYLVTTWNWLVKFWEVGSGALAGQMIARPRKATHGELCTAFSPNGEWFALGLWNVTLAWKFADCIAQFEASLADLQQPLHFPASYQTLAYVGNALSLRFLPDSRTLIVGRADFGPQYDGTFQWDDGPAGEGKLDFWDVPTQTLQATRTEAFLWPNCLALSPDGEWLAVPSRGSNASRGGMLRPVWPGEAWDGGIWLLLLEDWAAGESRDAARLLQGHRATITALAFAPDGRALASGSRDQSICLWDTEQAILTRTWNAHVREINTVAFAPTRQTLASGGGDADVTMWDAHSGELLWTQPGLDFTLNWVCFSPDGRHFAVAISVRDKYSRQADDHVRWHAWNLQTGQMWAELDSTSLESLAVWKVQTSARRESLEHAALSPLAPSPDSKWIAGRTDAQAIGLWDQETFALRADIVFEASPFAAYVFAWSADSEVLSGWGMHNNVYFWQAATGRLLGTLTILPNGMDWLVTTPDGAFEVSKGAAPFLRWRDGAQMHPFSRFAAQAHSAGLLKQMLQPEAR